MNIGEWQRHMGDDVFMTKRVFALGAAFVVENRSALPSRIDFELLYPLCCLYKFISSSYLNFDFREAKNVKVKGSNSTKSIHFLLPDKGSFPLPLLSSSPTLTFSLPISEKVCCGGISAGVSE